VAASRPEGLGDGETAVVADLPRRMKEIVSRKKRKKTKEKRKRETLYR
jgi:hypothetical protein